MSLKRLLKKEISEKYKNNSRILTPKSEKRFNIILISWILLGYVLATYIVVNNIEYSDCTICESISSFLPAIHIAAIGSRYPDAMHFVWLYSILTAPILLVFYFIFIRNFDQPILKHKWSAPLFILLALFCSYISFIGMSFGGQEAVGRLGRLYYKYLFFSTIVACGSAGGLVSMVFFLFHHYLAIYKRTIKGDES